MLRVLVIGAGGHGQVVADALQRIWATRGTLWPVGYLDDRVEIIGQMRLGLPVTAAAADLHTVEHDRVIVGVGDNRTRRKLFENLVASDEYAVTVIHPAAVVAPSAVIGAGTFIAAGAIVGPECVIGSNAILNTGCSVDHHSVIGDHVHIGPGARTGGEVVIGFGAFVGMGAVVLPQRRIGEWSIAGAGSVIHRDVPAQCVVVGVPARCIRHLAAEDHF